MIMTAKGDTKTNPASLRMLPDPIGKTPTHFPLAHYKVVDCVRQAIAHRAEGWGVEPGSIKSDYVLSAEGARCFALFNLMKDDGKWNRCIALRNSHDMSISLQVGGGLLTTVCTNLDLFPTIGARMKHTRQIQFNFDDVISDGLDSVSEGWKAQEKNYAEWETLSLSTGMVDSILMESMRQGVLPSSKLGQVFDAYTNPEFSEYGKGTAWTLHCAITHALRGSNLHTMESRTAKIKDVINFFTKQNEGDVIVLN